MNAARLPRTLLLSLLTVALASTGPRAVSPDIVISQVYGAGGNAGASYRNDFIELFNRGATPVTVTGWTVQYAATTGTSWQTTTLSGTIQPGRYYLVQEATGGGGTVSLPAPDATGGISMAAGAGKVALVRVGTALSGACPTGVTIADLLGYGTGTNCSETAPTGTLSATNAAIRKAGGAADTDDNSTDFALGAPTPRNSTTGSLSGIGAANPLAIHSGDPAILTVTVSPGTSPPSTGLMVLADLSSILGASAQPFADDGVDPDQVAGDNVFTFRATAITGAPGVFNLPATITDNEGRSASTTIALSIVAPPANVVISQVYGGGGNSGAFYRNDFIELRNRESFDVNVTGWSVQYASAAGSSWAATALTGTIPAGGYYLVQEAAGSGGTQPLPSPDASGTIAMSATNGKVALLSSSTLLTVSCPAPASTLDFVGYGTANCFEGTGAAPGLDNESAAIRLDGGLTDTNDNAADFVEGSPFPKSTLGVGPIGAGAAVPASIASGGVTLLTVTVTPGAFPPSPIANVTADLSAIGGSSEQPLFDDGTRGDRVPGDLVFSFETTVTGPSGFRVVPARIADERSRSGTASIRLAVEAAVTTSIAAIQGSGSTSPFAGQFVTTAGVVTALRSNGYFIQTQDGEDDGNPDTSEGIFVFTGGTGLKPSLGDGVHVSGVPSEFAPAPPNPPVTELSGGPAFAVLASGQPLPAPIALLASFTSPSGGNEQLERFEGMRVRADLTVIAPTGGTVFESSAFSSSNGDFYGVLDGLVRPVREPGLDPSGNVPPGLPCCVPHFDGNPERLRIESDGQVGASKIEVASGQRIFGLTGVLDFDFGSYTILPDPGAGTIVGSQQAAPVPEPADNEFTVGSFNLERFFDETDDPNKDDAVLTPEAVTLRLQKASLSIRHVLRSPDILGVVEVENLEILERLASRINADAVAAGDSDPQYVAYLEEGNDIGGIDSGFLVKSSTVHVLSVEQIGKTATYVSPDDPSQPLLLNDRPPLVLRVGVSDPLSEAELAVTVIVNHLRSLSGVDGDDGLRIRAKRRAQAEFLADLIQARQSTERVISVGDYNAFPFNDGFVDSIGTIKGQPTPADQVALASSDRVDPNLTNLGDSLGPLQQYSFVFDGNAQALDHVLVNDLALRRFSRLSYARSNADFPESLRGDAARAERVSDHDAIVAYFSFPGAPVVSLNGANPLTVEAYASFTDPGATAHDDEGPLPVMVQGTVDFNTPGDYTLVYTATNGFHTTAVTRTVSVRDTIAPSIVGLDASPKVVLSPSHSMIDVFVPYVVSDGSNLVSCSLSVSSNEPQNGQGDGNTATDWSVLDTHHVQVRAERSGRGIGRIYTIAVTCSDPSANQSTRTTTVLVAR
ncbi:MAG TPA: lamin tail domain-containing protein [Vicinamibacterales bacterium]|nr:lamin tail domain-containing protein [Vicinamibacterales bacterium]